MAIDAGNPACSSGLSKQIFDALTTPATGGDPPSGFSDPLGTSQTDTAKFVAFKIAQGIAVTVNAGSVLVRDEGVDQGTVQTFDFVGAGISISVAGGVATVTVTGGGGGVPTSRAINTTAPITGGGDLSADRTLAISAATTGAAGSMSAADKTKLDGIASGAAALSSATPSPLGTAAAGSGTSATRSDHVHAMPSLDQLVVPAADYAMNSHKFTGLGAGSGAGDSVRWEQTVAGILTTRGDLVRYGASGPERVAAKTSGNVVYGDGTDVVSGTLSALLDLALGSTEGSLIRRGASTWGGVASIAASQATTDSQVDDFSSSTPWTLYNGAGTAAITGGQCVLTTPSSVNSSAGVDRVYAARSLGITRRGGDVAIKLVSFTGTGATTESLYVEVAETSPSITRGFRFAITNNGAWNLYEDTGGTPLASGSAGSFSFAAALWFRFVFTQNNIKILTGTGSTFAGATWTSRYTATAYSTAVSPIVAPLPWIKLTNFRNATPASALVATLDDLTYTVF